MGFTSRIFFLTSDLNYSAINQVFFNLIPNEI